MDLSSIYIFLNVPPDVNCLEFDSFMNMIDEPIIDHISNILILTDFTATNYVKSDMFIAASGVP